MQYYDHYSRKSQPRLFRSNEIRTTDIPNIKYGYSAAQLSLPDSLTVERYLRSIQVLDHSKAGTVRNKTSRHHIPGRAAVK
jgi:hypothetical protein